MAGEAVPLAGLDGPHVATTSGQEEIDLQLSDASEQGSASAPQKSNSSSVKETKVIYHIDEEETPYLVKIVKDEGDGSSVRLKDFKNVLPTHLQRYKFFFKSQDDDFGVVKEEISLDESPLPLFNGRVVSWLVQAEGSVILSEAGGNQHHISSSRGIDELSSENGTSASSSAFQPPPFERSSGVGTTRPPSFHSNHRINRASQHLVPDSSTTTDVTGDGLDTTTAYDDTESSITSVSQIGQRHRQQQQQQARRHHRPPRLPGPGIQGPPGAVPGTSASVVGATTETSSMMSSEIESSVYEEDDDINSLASSSRFTTSTEHTSVSRNLARQQARHKQRSRRQRKIPAHLAGRADSASSVTDSTMSLNIITVTLNMDTVNFLGISIVGQSNKFGDGGDCGIYVGSIMKGGAVALDGRIEPGDMILQVNDTNFENMSNDDAVRVLREVVQKPGPIKLVVAKCWDPSPTSGQGGGGGGGGRDSKGGYLTIPRAEPVRPIDPGAWVAHTAAVRALDPPLPPESFVAESGRPLCMNPATATGRNRDLILLGDYPGRAPSVTTLSASSIVSSQPETEKYFPQHHLSRPRLQQQTSYPVDLGAPHSMDPILVGGGVPPPPAPVPIDGTVVDGVLSKSSGMLAITRAMRAPDSGLEVRDRMWLKIKIPSAFLGSDVVDWLYEKVDGFDDRREARKFACQLLKSGLVKHTVNKTTFSEQCYYAFGDEATLSSLADLSKLTLNDSRDSNETATSGGFGGPNAPLLRHQQPSSACPPPPPPLPPMMSNGSNGSNGDVGGIWGAGPTAPATSTLAPGGYVLPPSHQSPSGGSTYCGGQTIYNPAAPPPSANYSSMPPPYAPGSASYPAHADTSLFVQQPQQRTVSSSGSSHPSQREGGANMRLAGSGSGSESDCQPVRTGSGHFGGINRAGQSPAVLRPVPLPVVGGLSGGGGSGSHSSGIL